MAAMITKLARHARHNTRSFDKVIQNFSAMQLGAKRERREKRRSGSHVGRCHITQAGSFRCARENLAVLGFGAATRQHATRSPRLTRLDASV